MSWTCHRGGRALTPEGFRWKAGADWRERVGVSRIIALEVQSTPAEDVKDVEIETVERIPLLWNAISLHMLVFVVLKLRGVEQCHDDAEDSSFVCMHN